MDKDNPTSSWFVVGSRVFLCSDYTQDHRVGIGLLRSINPDDIGHTSRLGNSDVMISVEEVFEQEFILQNGDTLGEMLNAILRWPKVSIAPILEDDIHSSVNESMDFKDSSGTESDEPLVQERERDFENVIHRAQWAMLEVGVLDEEEILFAKASIQDFGARVEIRGVVLGDTHVGILFRTLLPDAGQQHLHYKDTLHPWPLEKLVAPDGRTMKVHDELSTTILVCLGQPQAKRQYSFIQRPKKRQRLGASIPKREKVVQEKAIEALSAQNCCGHACAQCFKRHLVRKVRQEYWGKNFEGRRDYIKQSLSNSTKLVDGITVIILEGVFICLKGWQLIHGIGKSQFHVLKKQFLEIGVLDIAHGNSGKQKMSGRVEQALMEVKRIVDECADNHPSKVRTLADNSKQILREMPKNLTWERIRSIANDTNNVFGLPPISQATMSKLRSTHFSDVAIKNSSDNFAKCTLCVGFANQKRQLKSKEELAKLREEEIEHHRQHTSGRLLYKSWRAISNAHPEDTLCIIHDKMDHSKTALPKTRDKDKKIDGVEKLPVSVTGILTHGHGPGAIAQYTIGIWKGGPNATIGSLDTILRMLENPKPMVDNMLQGPDSTTLSEVLMIGRVPKLKKGIFQAFNVPIPEDGQNPEGAYSSTSFPDMKKKLPRILQLQLDNCAGDNKNRFVLAYLSLLTAREVFEEVHVGFLMVGHTHEDVDAMFSHFSEIIRRNQALTLPELMHHLMISRKPSALPYLVQEIPDFKSYVKPFIPSGENTLVGHTVPRLFRLYVAADGMPSMQYKLLSMDDLWLPEEGIPMWNKNNDGGPSLPTGNPPRWDTQPFKALPEMVEGLEKYLDIFQKAQEGVEKSGSKDQHFKLLHMYWDRVIDIVDAGKVTYKTEGTELQYGFWPTSRWRDHVPPEFIPVACELDPVQAFVGPRRLRPLQAFHPRNDIKEGYFILVRPDDADLEIYNVHMGKAVSAVKNGHINGQGQLEHVVDVEWYWPMMRMPKNGQPLSIPPQVRWRDCWTKKWEKNPFEGITRGVSVNTVLWAFKGLNRKMPYLSITKKNADQAKDNLRRAMEAENIDYVVPE